MTLYDDDTQDSPPQATKDEVIKTALQPAYETAFKRLSDNKFSSAFTAQERESFDVISCNASYIQMDRTGVAIIDDFSKYSIRFQFGAPVTEITPPDGCLEDIALHEIKHCSLAYTASQSGPSSVNITRLRYKLYDPALKAEEHFRDAADYKCVLEASESQMSLFHLLNYASYVYHQTMGTVFHASHMALTPLICALSRKEEEYCDRFIIRAKPDADIPILMKTLSEWRTYRERNDPDQPLNGQVDLRRISLADKNQPHGKREQVVANFAYNFLGVCYETHPSFDKREKYMTDQKNLNNDLYL